MFKSMVPGGMTSIARPLTGFRSLCARLSLLRSFIAETSCRLHDSTMLKGRGRCRHISAAGQS